MPHVPRAAAKLIFRNSQRKSMLETLLTSPLKAMRYRDVTPMVLLLKPSPLPIESLVQRLQERWQPAITARPDRSGSPTLLGVLIAWFPMLLLIGVWVFFMRQMQRRRAAVRKGFGRSKAKLLTEAHGRVTFDDVAGIDEAKDDLLEIVEFLKDPAKFQRLGGRIPKGALLAGPLGHRSKRFWRAQFCRRGKCAFLLHFGF